MGKCKIPWVRIHLDLVGPYLGKKFLVVDSYWKWLDAVPMSNTKTTLLVQCIRHSFATHGLSFVIVTDNGFSFTSNKFKTFVQKKQNKTYFYGTLSDFFKWYDPFKHSKVQSKRLLKVKM